MVRSIVAGRQRIVSVRFGTDRNCSMYRGRSVRRDANAEYMFLSIHTAINSTALSKRSLFMMPMNDVAFDLRKVY